jgi:uncharacterized membrane protein YtjA (UPF0391 family)
VSKGLLAIRQLSPNFFQGEWTMLQYAVGFLVVALIAALFGFGLIASSFMEGAKILFFVFLVLAVLSLLGGMFRRSSA